MQRVNVLKQPDNQHPQHQQHLIPHQPHPEYSEKDIHKVIVTSVTDSDGTNLMQIRSDISDKVYSIHLEFTEDATGMGKEIRDTLKQKYLQQEWKTGALQTEPDAVQSSSQEGEREGQGV